MDTDKLNKWAQLLLDTGKRNNLVSFKDSKTASVELLYPSLEQIFSRAEQGASFEVFDTGVADDEDEPTAADRKKILTKEEYKSLFAPKIRRQDKVLIYNAGLKNPLSALKNIGKRAKGAIEETGVNIAYMAFGFIAWSDSEGVMRAPLLLIPVSIENDAATEPYRIRITDGEITVNPTFLFKLRSEWGVELPEYADEGVLEYLSRVEELVAPLKWEVLRECKLALFSFLKINMHKDLKDNAEKILKNRGVRTLLGEAALDSLTEGEEEGEEHELYTVVDADSSQTEAIELARSGRSFVLQGPPGTGKSQTITNIIAERLAEGKRVLFVSEKLAALEVVYEKLRRAGLEEFCLELHSHKANKRDVIEELCHTLRLGRSAVTARAEREIEARRGLEHKLDSYVEELHKIRPVINKSLFALYEESAAYRGAPECEYIIGNIRAKGEEHITEAESALSAYAEYTASLGYDYHKSCFFGYNDPDCSYEARGALRAELTDALTLCESLIAINSELYSKFRLRARNINEQEALRSLLSLLCESNFITPALLNSGTLAATRDRLRPMRTLAVEIGARARRINAEYDEGIYELDGKDLYKRLTGEFSGIFSRAFSKEYRALVAQIRLYKKDGKGVRYSNSLSVARCLLEYQQRSREFNSEWARMKGTLGAGFVGVDTDFDALSRELDTLLGIVKSGIDLSGVSKLKADAFTACREELCALRDRLDAAFSENREAEKSLAARFSRGGVNPHALELDALAEKYSECLRNIDSLDVWCELMKLIGRISSLDLLNFLDYAIKRKIRAEDISRAYKRLFFTQWVDAVLRDTPTLISLSRIPHDEAVRLFCEKDETNFEINKAKIKAKLSSLRPSLDMVAAGSAIAQLLREGEKKRGQMGIRRLLEQIGELAQTLKPCFLMSPLSVSTFLSPNMSFDTVVFDEASQIFPEDAVGAIYRGRQLIVVGDSKQMPPSNFFNTTSYETQSEEEGDACDFESILDICSASFLQKRLRWHYRSRHEELIAFSNKNFYDGELVSFPSSMVDREGIGVDFVYASGVFDRATRTNLKEAQRVVELVFEHIRRHPDRSLGVVAFSIAQQSLIDKLIAKRRVLEPACEAFFKSDSDEPFFVKNLETVQGDERDTIIFSVAYGKDTEGRFIHNFGPINREGGERRLNVAVTRAKINVKLVASIRYTDIDLSRCESVGAGLLREYLDYAENGAVALSRRESENPFESRTSELVSEVADFLRASGYRLDTGVGCSSLKVDIAVKGRHSDDYVLAVECDGGAYRASRTTRDRDRLRGEVLSRMGWKYYRVWSVDWFRNKRAERERLLAAAKAAVENIPSRQKTGAIELEDDFIERIGAEKFDLPRYKMADERSLAEQKRGDRLAVIREIVNIESPVSEEWLMRRLSFLWGKDKVTPTVRDLFGYELRNAKAHGIIRDGGFLLAEGREIPMLRIPEDDAPQRREIKHIHKSELALGMREILRENITVEKKSLFLLVARRLGFTRVGEAMEQQLEAALGTLSGELLARGDTLSLKK